MFKGNKRFIGAGLLFVFLSLGVFPVFGQEGCDIRDYYDDFIEIQRAVFDGESHFSAKIKDLEVECPAAGLINHNRLFMDYLLVNFSSGIDREKLRKVSDTSMWNAVYVADLRKDNAFDKLITEWVAKAVEGKLPKDTVTQDELLNIGVKFFEIQKVSEKGLYTGRICVGGEELEATESERKPFLEAFCFSSIFKHLSGEPFNLYNELIDAIREIYKVNLGDNDEEELLRAQGALFVLMRRSEKLSRMLHSEYEKNKQYLPFVLVEKRVSDTLKAD